MSLTVGYCMKVARSPSAKIAAKTPVWASTHQSEGYCTATGTHSYLDGTANEPIQNGVCPTESRPRLQEAPDEKTYLTHVKAQTTPEF